MTLRDLVLKMRGEEKIVVYKPAERDITTTVDELINEDEYEWLLTKNVGMIWNSRVYNAIMIELEEPQIEFTDI